MWRIAFLCLCCATAAPTWATPRDNPARAAPTSRGIDRAVQMLCSKQIVLLGEDNHHASAATIALKVQLVKRLVQQCGFRGVVFESQFYDMLNFEHSIAAGFATREQLADAIGAVWSRYAAFAPLETWLFTEASAGRVRVAGMDPQVGGITDRYSLEQLPAVLSSVLAGERRVECERIIKRQNQATHDDAYPFDAQALRRLKSCVQVIRGRLAAMGHGAPTDLKAMADSYANYLECADGSGPGLRDRAMYRNLAWMRARWPEDTRIVIWTASVHAAKTFADGSPEFRPLGSYVHEALGERAAAIDFTVLGGRYGNVGGHGALHVIPAAARGSLEARAFAEAGSGTLRFLDHAQLKAMGPISARALDYSKPSVLDWSQVLDGMIVLRKETAAVAMH